MSLLTRVAKRLVIGRPVSSERLADTALSKRIALPIFASDALSSVTYATQEILLVLTVGGTAYLFVAPWVAAGIVMLFAIVVASYRQVVRAYPSGGGDYEVATTEPGPVRRARRGQRAAGRLRAHGGGLGLRRRGQRDLGGARTSIRPGSALALGLVALLTAINLRGVRESGTAFAIPTYAFIAGRARADRHRAASHPVRRHAAGGECRLVDRARAGHTGLAGLALLFFALRAFSSGCTALTGVEAIANGVPAFRPPRAATPPRTLAMIGVLAITMFAGITALALVANVHVAENTCDLVGFPGDCATDPQRTVIAQLGAAVFGGDHSIGFYYIQAATALILILAANTAFNGFPLLGSILAQDRYLPRQLHTRGDRLAFSNGIVAAGRLRDAADLVFDASVTRLIQLYILGVFTSFTLGQAGHGPALEPACCATERDREERRRILRSRAINAIGATVTGPGAGHRAGHQVPARRLDRGHRDAAALL